MLTDRYTSSDHQQYSCDMHIKFIQILIIPVLFNVCSLSLSSIPIFLAFLFDFIMNFGLV